MLGQTCCVIKEINNAIDHYNQAIELYTALENSTWQEISYKKLGQLYQEIQEYEKAIELYQKRLILANELQDQDGKYRSLEGIGDCFKALEKSEEAWEKYLQALAIAEFLQDTERINDIRYALQSLWNKLLDKECNSENILSIIDKVLLQNANSFWLWIFKGDISKLINNFEMSVYAYTRALEIDDINSELLVCRAIAFKHLDRYGEALCDLDKSLKLEPELHSAWRMRGDILCRLRRYEEAISSYEHLSKPESDSLIASVWSELGNEQLNSGQHLSALSFYNRSLQIKRDTALVWLHRSIALKHINQYEDALASLNFALELEPENHHIWCNRSNILLNLKRYQDALECSQTAAETLPTCPNCWLVRGAILANGFQSYVEALAAFERCLTFQPDNEDAQRNKKSVLQKLGFSDLETDQEFLSQNHDLNDPQNCIVFAIRLKLQNDLPGALQAVEYALKLNPQDYKIWREKGNILWQLESFQESFDAHSKAIELNPDDFQLYIMAGNSLLNMQKYQEALDVFEKVLQLTHGQSWQAWAGKGLAFLHCGDFDTAIAIYKEGQCKISARNSDYLINYSMLSYHQGLAFSTMASWENAENFFQKALKYLPDELDYGEWRLQILQEIIAVYREQNKNKLARKYTFDGIKLFSLLEKSLFPNSWPISWFDLDIQSARNFESQHHLAMEYHQQQNLSLQKARNFWSKQFSRLITWYREKIDLYRSLFNELLNGIEQGWTIQQSLEHLGELYDDSCFIEYLSSFIRCPNKYQLDFYHLLLNGIHLQTTGYGRYIRQSMCSYATTFDLGYRMCQLRGMGLGEIEKASVHLGQELIRKVLIETEEFIDQVHQKYLEGKLESYGGALTNYCSQLDKYIFDYRVFQTCTLEYQRKLEDLEHKLVAHAISTTDLGMNHIAWFELGESLRNPATKDVATIAFNRVLRITCGKFWQAWESRCRMLFRSDNYAHRFNEFILTLADAGLKILILHSPDAGNLEQLLDDIKIDYSLRRDYWQEGCGVLYEIKGDWYYGYDAAKGLITGSITADIEFWYVHFEIACEYYRKALEYFSTPRLRERRLNVLKKISKVYRRLGMKDEAQVFEWEGIDLLGRLLAELPSDQQKASLAYRFAAFDQQRVDSLIDFGHVLEALYLAEQRKALRLSWMRSQTWSSQDFDKHLPFDLFHPQIEALLKPNTAIIYWHISPAAITVFVLKQGHSPKAQILKNEFLKAIADNQSLHFNDNSTIIPSELAHREPTQEATQKASACLFGYQLTQLENWLESWQISYQGFRENTHPIEEKEVSLETTKECLNNNSHNWYKTMEEELNRLKIILNIDEIILEHLTNVKELILIPHRDLHRIPLEYLFQDREFIISRLPSLYTGFEATTFSTPKQIPLIIENIGEENNELFYAPVELEIVAFATSKSYRLSQASATKKHLLQFGEQEVDILHFIGHGQHNLENPNESALLFADSSKLTLREIFNFPLQPFYLVCLSACETGLTSQGQLLDEFVGLVSAFLSHKTGYVLSTLWTVNDLSTCLLIQQFYQHLLAGEDPAAALLAAQKWLRMITYDQVAKHYKLLGEELKQYLDRNSYDNLRAEAKAMQIKAEQDNVEGLPFSHPYYWVGFTITGRVNS